MVEVESEEKLLFLDVLLQRDPDGSISTTVYRKATNTDRYLDFMSHHPLAHTFGVVKTVHSRAGAIGSDVTVKGQETWHIRQALISNCYPRGVLQHLGHLLALDPQMTRNGVRLSLFPMSAVCQRQCDKYLPQ